MTTKDIKLEKYRLTLHSLSDHELAHSLIITTRSGLKEAIATFVYDYDCEIYPGCTIKVVPA